MTARSAVLRDQDKHFDITPHFCNRVMSPPDLATKVANMREPLRPEGCSRLLSRGYVLMGAVDRASFFEIQRVVEDWVIFRDSGQFDRLMSLWHDDGRMMTTWAQVSASEFVARSRMAFANGAMVNHSLSGCHIDIVGDRAIAQTKMSITQRGAIDGILCDATCDGRFYDFFECRDGNWRIVLRQPIYERDRISPVEPGAALVFDQTVLQCFPEGYRYLAYLQTKLGMVVKTDMPGLRGPEIEAIYAKGAQWLAGDAEQADISVACSENGGFS